MGNPYSVYVLLGLFRFTAPRSDVIVILYDKFSHGYLSHIAAFWMILKLSSVTGLFFLAPSNTASTRYNMHTSQCRLHLQDHMWTLQTYSSNPSRWLDLQSQNISPIECPVDYKSHDPVETCHTSVQWQWRMPYDQPNSYPPKVELKTLGSLHSTCRTNKLWTTTL